MIIEDGKGTGSKAEVNGENQMEVSAICMDMVEHKNKDHHAVWYVALDAIAPSGATKFLYIGNGGQTNVAVSKLRLASTVAGVFRFVKVTGTPVGGTAVLPTPAFMNSVQQPPAGTFLTGTSITGLTDFSLIMPIYIPANVLFTLDLTAKWYVAPGTAIAVQAPGAATVNGVVTIYTEDGD
jgi:hypothetical protein